jgi:mevalonate pyrophosphate decarboxylase
MASLKQIIEDAEMTKKNVQKEAVKGSVSGARQMNSLLVAAKKRGDSYMVEAFRVRRDDWMDNARLLAA